MLQIHNSLSNRKETFKPINPGEVRLYVCGMTVYDYCHLGHARVMVVFDTVVRYLRSLDYKVTYVRNITDIDDKIIARARDNGEDFHALTQRFIDAMHEDTEALGVLPPDAEPRATDSIDIMHDLVHALEDKGYAYVGGNGDVYYDVSRFEGYGKLSGGRPEDLRSGARIEVNEAKQDPLDFVLWKQAKPDEPSWGSPWGNGRPGWHLECSAMSTDCLGEHFDIHGGGMDLKFPHHENEIAQSEGALGHKHVNVWMHNGFVRVDDEKMSKSLNNFFTVREILRDHAPEVVRFFLVNSHYRSPLNYTDQNLHSARASLDRLYTALRGLNPSASEVNGVYLARFREAMDDDFNTPEALAVLFDLGREVNRLRDEGDLEAATRLAGTLRALGGILGLLQDDPEAYLQRAGGQAEEGLSAEAIEDLIARRTQARADKDWAGADRIRDELLEQGVTLEDGAGATSWRRS